jgi:hypothetical protein
MCLYIHKKYPHKYEALRDIKVYKYLDDTDGKYTSPFQGTFWKKKNSKEVIRKRVTGIRPYGNSPEWLERPASIEYGLHSLYVLNRPVGRILIGPPIQMVIPKGALFYIGTRGDIVSTELIWDEKRSKKAKHLTLKELP